MINGNSDDIAKLVEPGRVIGAFMPMLTSSSWRWSAFSGAPGCSSGMPAKCRDPGDYITTELGRQPVIMTRHRDGNVHVLLNRCTHRGAKVVNERQGHARPSGLLLSRLDLRYRRHAS